MATKTAIEKQEPGAMQEFGGGVVNTWRNFTRFLSDVRAEMRKVVVPSQKEVKVTTSVVIVAVFIFGLFFFVVDFICRIAMNGLLDKLTTMK